MPLDELDDRDIISVIDVILDWLEIVDIDRIDLDRIDLDRIDLDVGDIPPASDIVVREALETIVTNPEVREAVSKRVAAAQAEGRAFPLPTARELAAARERQLARRKRGS